jgi:hypothetical protein
MIYLADRHAFVSPMTTTLIACFFVVEADTQFIRRLPQLSGGR